MNMYDAQETELCAVCIIREQFFHRNKSFFTFCNFSSVRNVASNEHIIDELLSTLSHCNFSSYVEQLK